MGRDDNPSKKAEVQKSWKIKPLNTTLDRIAPAASDTRRLVYFLMKVAARSAEKSETLQFVVSSLQKKKSGPQNSDFFSL